jgi:hypothetical protein
MDPPSIRGGTCLIKSINNKLPTVGRTTKKPRLLQMTASGAVSEPGQPVRQYVDQPIPRWLIPIRARFRFS